MERKPVKSSNIKSIGFEASSETLHIEFASGDVYEYKPVHADKAWALLNAKSIGAHFAKEIRPHFKGEKLKK